MVDQYGVAVLPDANVAGVGHEDNGDEPPDAIDASVRFKHRNVVEVHGRIIQLAQDVHPIPL